MDLRRFVRRFFWLLWFAAATFAGGFVGWFLVVVALHATYSGRPAPSVWVLHLLLMLGLVFGAIAGAVFAYLMGELPRQFSLRTLFIATTLIAVVLGLIVWAV